jgi:hypothetical protein
MCVMVAVDAPTPMTATPRELVPIIERCLAKTPDERYPHVAALAHDLARLAREPDKAQLMVDRMHRMMERAANRRTPPAGIPELSLPLAGQLTPEPAPASLPVARAVRSAATSPTNGVPRVAVGPPYTMPVAMPQVQLTSAPPYPMYPLPLDGDAPYLRPGLQLPRGATNLTTTQIIARRDRGWVVAVTAALVALAAGIAVVAATHSGRTALRQPADDRPDVIRMTPNIAPPAPAPTPTAGSGTESETAALPRAPGMH